MGENEHWDDTIPVIAAKTVPTIHEGRSIVGWLVFNWLRWAKITCTHIRNRKRKSDSLQLYDTFKCVERWFWETSLLSCRPKRVTIISTFAPPRRRFSIFLFFYFFILRERFLSSSELPLIFTKAHWTLKIRHPSSGILMYHWALSWELHEVEGTMTNGSQPCPFNLYKTFMELYI